MALGLAAVLIVVIAGLALLNSFFVDLAPGQPDPNPGGGDQQGGEEGPSGGEGPECETFVSVFQWIFIVLLVSAVTLFAVAVARRHKTGGRIGTSLWGLLSIVAAFLAVMAFGAWRLLNALCEGALTCGSANDGTFSSFMFVLVITVLSIGAGITLSHVGRRNFFGTGWGLLGLLMVLPTLLTGLAWFVIRTFCTPDLSCATRDEFLAGLATIFWATLAGSLVATAVGLYVQKRFDHGIFKSGWAVLAIVLFVVAVLAGAGWLYVDSLVIPGCDEIEQPEETEPVTCEEMRDDLLKRLRIAMLVVGLGGLGALVVGLVIRRDRMKGFAVSPWAIIGYVALGLLVILGFAYLLVSGMCDEGELDEGEGEGGDGGGGGDGGNGGNSGGGGNGGGGGNSGGGGSGGGGGGGSGSGSGPGGGGGGTGDANPLDVPVQLDPKTLMWLLVALLAVVAVALLFVMLRHHRGRIKRDKGEVLATQTLKAKGRQDVMKLLAQGKLMGAAEVIAAYRAFLDWSSKQGDAIRIDETPREHARRVAKAHELPPQPMHEFIRAYEMARLSLHEPSATQRESAVRFARGLAAKKKEEGAA